jgi:hypothetical protein
VTRHRLQFQIFGALIGTGFVCALIVTLVMWLFYRDLHPLPRFAGDLGEMIVERMPPADSPAFEREFRRRARRLHVSMTLWDAAGRPIARAGRPITQPGQVGRRRGYVNTRNDAIFVRLEDGRLLGVAFEHGFVPEGGGRRLFAVLLFLAVVLLIGSHGAALRISRRLSLLESTVSRFGDGGGGTKSLGSGTPSTATSRASARCSGSSGACCRARPTSCVLR